MFSSRRSHRLISVCVHQLSLLLTIQLICHAVNCNYTKSNEFTATHPNSHPTQRDTTSTPPRLDDWQNRTPAVIDFTNDNYAVNSNSSDFPKTNERSAVNVSSSAKTVSVFDYRLGNDDYDVVAGQQVLEHVIPLTYTSQTSDSPGHVTNMTNDSTTINYSTDTGSGSTNPRLSAVYDDVIISSPQGVTKSSPVTSRLLPQEPTANVSGGTSVWESWTTNVEPATLQYTGNNGNGSSDQLITSSVTSPNHTLRHHAHVLIARGKSRLSSSLFTEYSHLRKCNNRFRLNLLISVGPKH